jgi:Ca2+-binding EF-hand superfamily protein
MNASLWTGAALALLLAAAPARPAAPPPREAPDADVQDAVVLAEGGPIRLRLRLRIDGKAYAARWRGHLARLFDFLDRNGDGVLDKDEAARAPTLPMLQGQMQGNPFLNLGGPRVPFAQLDGNGDGKVTLEEFMDFYRTTSAGPLQVVPGFFGVNQDDPVTEALFKALDADGDGKLSLAELARAEMVLGKLDFNDDEMISAQELLIGYPSPPARVRPPRRMRGMMALPGRRPAAPGSPLLLVGKDAASRRSRARMDTVRAVLNHYDKDGNRKLSREEIGLPEVVFKRLDRNRDGELDLLELLAWTATPPDVEVVVRLGRDRSGPPVEAVARPGAGKGTVSARNEPLGALLLTAAGTGLRVSRGGFAGNRFGNTTTVRRVFAQIDRERRGFITAEQLKPPQYAFLRSILQLADRDDDGRLTKAELDAYLGLVQKAAGSQTTLTLTDRGRGLFQILDANGDGQLGIRELRTAWERLAPYADGDGYISRAEIPRQYQLTVSQGAPALNPNFQAGVTPRAARPARGPLWFRKMDRNGDGDVSRAEFLGSEEDFRRIDTDGDGLISVEEAERADAWFRARPKQGGK